MRNNNRRGNRNFGGNNFRNDRPQMYQTTCSSCGNSCEVPFKPTGKRPVLCSSCFEKEGGNSRRDRPERDFSKRNFGDRKMFEAICDKCGSTCNLPFKPTPGKPIYCDNCFGKEKKSGKSSDSYKEQFEALNAKLDKLITLLSPAEVSKPKASPDKKESKAKPEAKKPATQKAAKEKKATTKKKTTTKKVTK